MFFKKKRKSQFGNRIYKVERKSRLKYKNPLRIKKGIFKFKIFRIINIILILGIIGVIYFFVFGSFYHITNIEIYGNQINSTDDILDVVNNYLASNKLVIFKNKNILLLNRDSLAKEIQKKMVFEDITIEKILPNTLKFTFVDKIAVIQWQTSGQEYLVDINGEVIKRNYKILNDRIFQLEGDNDEQITEIEPSEYIVVNNIGNQKINLSDKVLAAEDVLFIKDLVANLQNNSDINITNISVPNNFPRYLTLDTQIGYLIHFNIADGLKSQINRLEIIIKEKIKNENLKNIEYIDLRYGDSVFFK